MLKKRINRAKEAIQIVKERDQRVAKEIEVRTRLAKFRLRDPNDGRYQKLIREYAKANSDRWAVEESIIYLQELAAEVLILIGIVLAGIGIVGSMLKIF